MREEPQGIVDIGNRGSRGRVDSGQRDAFGFRYKHDTGVLMNTRGIAYINHGRWLVDCPGCGSPVLIKPPEPAACGHCHPELFAVMFVKRRGEIYDPVPDHERRE